MTPESRLRKAFAKNRRWLESKGGKGRGAGKGAEEELPPVDFGDADAGGAGVYVGVRSTWRDGRSLSESYVQAEPPETAEGGAQTTPHGTVGSQTSGREIVMEGMANLGTSTSDADLAPFLRRTSPDVVRALRRNVASAEDGEVDYRHALGERDAQAAVVSHHLRPAQLMGGGEGAASSAGGGGRGRGGDSGAPYARYARLCVTGVSWNATGNVVAVSYGRNDLDGWCTDPGAVCSWNINRAALDECKPDVLIEVDNCVQSVAMHPSHPGLVCGGTYNGEVFLWNLSAEEEPEVSRSSVSDAGHCEPVVRVAWVAPTGVEAGDVSLSQIVSLAGDGKVLVWSVASLALSKGRGALSAPVQGYVLHSHRVSGGTALGFSRLDAALFVAGTESGAVYKCTHRRSAPTAGEPGLPPADSLPQASTFELEPCVGAVHGIDCSPFHRNLALAVGVDSTVRIYNLLQRAPVRSLMPSAAYLYCAEWSPFRPAVFAVGAGDGYAHLYDLDTDAVHPVISLPLLGIRSRGAGTTAAAAAAADAASGASGAPAPTPEEVEDAAACPGRDRASCFAMAFNPVHEDLVAVSGGGVAVRIWSLAGRPDLTHHRGTRELRLLAALAALDDDGEDIEDAR